MILYFKNIRLRTGAHKPARNNYAGQKWATAEITIDGKPVQCHFDQRLGANMYFQIDDQWHYLRMSSQHSDKHQYSFNPFEGKVKFKTKP